MCNCELARDYLHRATVRREAIDVLHRHGSWADVVRKCQQAVELALMGLLRTCCVDPPRTHDVSAVLLASRQALPASVQPVVGRLAEASRALRRDHATFDAEVLPSAFYRQADAERALTDLDFVLATVGSAIPR